MTFEPIHIALVIAVAVAIVGLAGWIGRKRTAGRKKDDMLEAIVRTARDHKLQIFADAAQAAEDNDHAKFNGVKRRIFEAMQTEEGLVSIFKAFFYDTIARVGKTGTAEQATKMMKAVADSVRDRVDLNDVLVDFAKTIVMKLMDNKEQCAAFKTWFDKQHMMICDNFPTDRYKVDNVQHITEIGNTHKTVHETEIESSGGKSKISLAHEQQLQQQAQELHKLRTVREQLTPGPDVSRHAEHLTEAEIHDLLEQGKARKRSAGNGNGGLGSAYSPLT